MPLLLLPGDPGFSETLALNPPPSPNHQGNIFVMGAEGLLRFADDADLEEYLLGGEYDEIMGDQDLDFEEGEEDEWL